MAGKLRPVPDAPRRALGMIRVSKERDGMMSPDVQRAAITDYCRSRGYVVVDWLEGIDQSGSRTKSAWWPRLDDAIASVESGAFDVIVVWKFSRTARNRLKWAVALDRVDLAGGSLESATEQVDATTSMGRFTRGMLGELNAFEAERIGEVWKEVHASRVAAGRAPTGKPKYGYIWNTDNKVHEVDPETGPVLAEAYRRYIAGESVYSLVRWLNNSGRRTTAGLPWSDRSLRRVLDAGHAAGFIPWGGVLHPGIHEPLIDGDTWQAYLDARVTRRAAPARRERSQYLLSGLVRCARCGGSMAAGQFGQQRMPKYRCQTSKEQGPEQCAGGYVMASYVEAAVVEWLQSVADPIEERVAAVDLSAAVRVSAEGDARRLSRELEKVNQTLRLMARQLGEGLIEREDYLPVQRDLVGQRELLTGQLEEAGRAARALPVDPGEAARGLLATWDERPVHARRQVLARLLRHVSVTTGRPHATFEISTTWDA